MQYLIVLVFIFNIIILYRVIKNKKKLSTNSSFINLNNINNKKIEKVIIPLLCGNCILSLLNIIIGKMYSGYILVWVPIWLICIPIIYIDNECVGTVWRCVDTKNIDFMEVSKVGNNIKIIFKYKDKTYKKVNYTRSASVFNKDDMWFYMLVSRLREYGYEVHIDTLK
ncbi:hypothetical protein [Clostridium baratii]|uniref:hypothetical protein n=1 Tax=Clostridium baratii TaxID=1561 RepID=UPI0030D17A0E